MCEETFPCKHRCPPFDLRQRRKKITSRELHRRRVCTQNHQISEESDN